MTDEPTPPGDLPEAVARDLRDCDDSQLRAVIDYAQRLLADPPSLTDRLDPRPGEEIVRIDDHGAYTSVVVERPDATGEARGPFAYHVTWEPAVEGEGGQYAWRYLGRVDVE